MGFTVKGNSATQKVLGNPVCAGMVRVPADGKRPKHYVKALHQPLVSEGDFWLLEMLGSKRTSKAQPEERFPLWGILKCWCGLHMTAGLVKGSVITICTIVV